MIPIYDDNPTHRIPWVTIALIVTNLTVFAYELWLTPAELSAFIQSYAFISSDFFADPATTTQLLRITGAMFMHAGWVHLLSNMLYLWIFGKNVEDRLGHWRFMLFYLLGGAVATMSQAALSPTSSIPLIGASGAIAAVLGAYVLLYPRARIVTLIPIIFYLELATIPAVFVIGFWFLLQLAQGLGSIAATGGGIAWWAHIGGFVFGVIAITPIALSYRYRSKKRSRQNRSRNRRTNTQG